MILLTGWICNVGSAGRETGRVRHTAIRRTRRLRRRPPGNPGENRKPGGRPDMDLLTDTGTDRVGSVWHWIFHTKEESGSLFARPRPCWSFLSVGHRGLDMVKWICNGVPTKYLLSKEIFRPSFGFLSLFRLG